MSETLLEELKALECSLHAARRNDREWLEQILHPEFREITRSGVMVDRVETIASLTGEADVPVEVPVIVSSDFSLIRLAADAVIVNYRTVNPQNRLAALRCSCWVRGDSDRWQLIFHQGTPAAGGDVDLSRHQC